MAGCSSSRPDRKLDAVGTDELVNRLAHLRLARVIALDAEIRADTGSISRSPS